MNHTCPFLRVVFAEVDHCACMAELVDRQTDQILNAMLCCMQPWISTMWSCWWWMLVTKLRPKFSEAHVSILAFCNC